MYNYLGEFYKDLMISPMLVSKGTVPPKRKPLAGWCNKIVQADNDAVTLAWSGIFIARNMEHHFE